MIEDQNAAETYPQPNKALKYEKLTKMFLMLTNNFDDV